VSVTFVSCDGTTIPRDEFGINEEPINSAGGFLKGTLCSHKAAMHCDDTIFCIFDRLSDGAS
jgi:hypothetical protein